MTKSVLVFVLAILPVFSIAQQTGGVFPPGVNEGHRSWQYRAAFDPDTNGFAQRLHYQQAIDGNTMWRILGQTRRTNNSDTDFDFLQGELFWELSDDNPNHRYGFRFDLRIRDDNRPSQIGWNWMNQFNFNDGWSARTILLTSYQFGNNAANGVAISTRFQVAKQMENRHSIGIEVFNSYGRTTDFADFDEQNHAIGPIYSLPVSEEWTVFGGILFGVTDASPDTQGRFWLTRTL